MALAIFQPSSAKNATPCRIYCYTLNLLQIYFSLSGDLAECRHHPQFIALICPPARLITWRLGRDGDLLQNGGLLSAVRGIRLAAISRSARGSPAIPSPWLPQCGHVRDVDAAARTDAADECTCTGRGRSVGLLGHLDVASLGSRWDAGRGFTIDVSVI